MLASFAAWRRRIVRGRYVRLNRIENATVWGAYFLPLRQADAGLCHFVLRRLLHPNPRRRADTAELVRFCARRIDVGPER